MTDPISDVARGFRQRFESSQRVLSFDQYFELYLERPERHGRDAARYLRDIFDHFGRVPVDKPWGKETRFSLFDLPFAEGGDRDRLVGQEAAQAEVYRILANFAREGRANKLILLHGPNGSSKSTFVGCIMRALEHYSQLEEGALYRFNWIFPGGRHSKSIGFSGGEDILKGEGTFAHLDEADIDAKLACEVRDHPLLLLPHADRKAVMARSLEKAGVVEPPPDYLSRGEPCHKCKAIFDALANAYRGDLKKVLRHVQVERYFVSRRYRVGAVTIGPQMSVDAAERQVTVDRSLSSLPASLQTVTIYEPYGELVDAAGGLLEFSDLLKRPIESFKYLLITIETGEVPLQQSILYMNSVLIANSNEIHLAAFKEHPEFNSFRGRVEMIRIPYLLDWQDERRIYDLQIVPQVRRHVAPHATAMAALWAVLTRMRKPVADKYGKALGAAVSELGPLEKAELYATGVVPPKLNAEAGKELKTGLERVYRESEAYPNYEGRFGASPREIRTLILDAAQRTDRACLSPWGVLDEIEELCKRIGEYEFLKQETLPGGYHDNRGFITLLRERLLDVSEDELRSATGLVEEGQYLDLFNRYVEHVSHWVKHEKIHNRATGAYEDPDEDLMRDLEKTLEVGAKPDEFRKGLISAIAAYAIDHPGRKPSYDLLFPRQLRKLKESYFLERRSVVGRICDDVLRLLTDGAGTLEAESRKAAEQTLARAKERFQYCDACLRDTLAFLRKNRFSE